MVDKELDKKIKEALKDERMAPKEYRELRRHLKSKRMKSKINEIIRDEVKHQKVLLGINRQVSTNQRRPTRRRGNFGMGRGKGINLGRIARF